MTLFRSAFVLFIGICFLGVSAGFADEVSSDPRLYARWRSVKVLGTPCHSLIQEVQYLFTDDYIYEIDAAMHRLGGILREKAQGTYTLNNNTITGNVDGQTIGPFRYRFAGKQLVIEQSNPLCTIYLERISPGTQSSAP